MTAFVRRALRVVLVSFLPVALFAAGDLEWPAITSQTKPWGRWWWLGNIGTKADFTADMESYARAGFGGLEITPIYGVRGEEARSRQYLSPDWMDLLDHVLDEGQRLGLGIDMSTGTGWPFGGQWVTPDFAARHYVTKSFSVAAGASLSESVRATETPIVRVAGPRRVEISELKDPVASNANLQDLALDQVRFPRRLPLHTLIAYGPAGEKIDLTAKVDANGKLDWTAPAAAATASNAAAANWTLYAIFLGWHGKQVERAAPGGEGDVIDHFSHEALARYLKHFDDAYAGHRANRLRGYFNDSYEVDDASGESNWTPKFFEEFKRRRGYDLRDELPAFFGKDTPEKNARVMSDHRETISDLLLEEFTEPWAKWAAAHGALVRNQAHGSPANIIDLYAASGIPETEGANPVGMKQASSAAHLTGKPLVGSETATWLDEHWVSTLGDIKRRVDLTFLGGVNFICYHGTVFSPPGEPWPGHHFYASVELDPSNSIFADASVLNRYVARCQSFLQSGKPAEDILLYYPIYDTWAQRNAPGTRGAAPVGEEGAAPGGIPSMPHFGGGQRGGGLGVAGELFERGYTFDFVTDKLLKTVTFSDGALRAGGVAYKVILVPETKHMPLETLSRLFDLAAQGATVVFQKNVPEDVPGLGRLNERLSAMQVHAESLRRAKTDADGTRVLAWSKGKIVVGDKWEPLVAGLAAREPLVDHGLRFVRRAHEKGFVYFVLNPRNEAFEGWLPLGTPAAGVALFDAGTGEAGVGRSRRGADGRAEIFLQLAPNESRLVKTFTSSAPAGPAFRWRAPSTGAQPLAANWTIRFVNGGPTLPAEIATRELRSWTDLGGDDAKAFSGTASYRTTFRIAHRGDQVLELGQVADSARVRVNGREVAAVIAPPWQAFIPADVLKDGDNELEILVTNLAANRIAELDRRDPSWKHFYNTNYPARIGTNRGPDGNFSAAKWPPRASGLLGPVTLAPAGAPTAQP